MPEFNKNYSTATISKADTNRDDAISLWDLSAEETIKTDQLSKNINVDVAIVGAGFTGLSTALHLAEQDRSCCVVESNSVGFGGSGRNVGLVNAGLWLPPQDIRQHLGEEKGKWFVDQLGNAPAEVFSLIERYQMRCEATRTGTIHAAHSTRGYQDLARRADEWQRLGAPVELLDRKTTIEKIGTPLFHGGLLDHRAGTINPMGYSRGLARAILGHGAPIYTGSRVNKLYSKNSKWTLQTSEGTITANSVVLGTNAYTDSLWPGLMDTFTMIHYFQVATVPLGSAADHILAERQGVWDTGKIMFSLRKDAFGRLIVGSMGKILDAKMPRGTTHFSELWAKRRLKNLFPELDSVEFEKSWHGQIAMTPDHLPRIHQLAENVYTPIGYNGRGITTGTVFGRAIAELLTDGDTSKLPIPITSPKSVPLAKVKSRIFQSAFTARKLLKSIH